MSQPSFEAGLVSGRSGRLLNLTLLPLQTDRQAALAPDLTLGIAAARLIKVGQRWHNAFNEVTVRNADDLFACAAQEDCLYDPVPLGADLSEANLNLWFAERPEPHLIQIRPPHTLILQDPSDSARIIAFLRHRGFILNDDDE